MAEINLQANLVGQATVFANATRQTLMKSSIVGHSTITANTTRQALIHSAINGQATVTANTIKRIITSSQFSGFGEVTVNADAWRFKGIRADIRVNARLKYFRYDRDIKSDMWSYIPPFYQEFELVRQWIERQSIEFTRLNANIAHLMQQHSLTSADNEGISLHEEEMQIHINTSNLEKRKAHIKSLVNPETFKLANISSAVGIVCDAVGIPEEYKVDITLKSVRGKPKNIKEVKETVDMIVPSHLDPNINYSYLPWDEIEQVSLVWNEAENYALKELEETFLVPFQEEGGS